MILLSLAIAAFWGAAHALTPGHGKAIVAGYLVGTKGRPVDAVLLGGIVTVTHTIGVFALGLRDAPALAVHRPRGAVSLADARSGVLVIAVGGSVLVGRFRARGHGHGHHHHHGHGHDHDHGHSHAIDRRGLLGVGVAAGLLPCPSALVVLLSAIALHRIGFGLALIVAFSLGLAATITSIGLVAVLAKRAFSRLSLDGPVVRLLPAASALVILAVGVGITLKALPGVLYAMFGLDDHIAALSHGGSILIVLLVATLLGLRHATDPDHLAAVTTLMASGRENARRRAAALGAWWGLGHALTLVVFGVPILLFEAYLPELVQRARRPPSRR